VEQIKDKAISIVHDEKEEDDHSSPHFKQLDVLRL